MTNLPPIVGERAEAAVRLLNMTLGFHRNQIAAVTRRHSRRLGEPGLDGLQTQRQATVLRMISITEAFCGDRLLGVAESEVEPAGSTVRNIMWQRASTDAVGSWPSMKAAYKKWYGVRPVWTNLETLVDVRNSIAHGLGELTRQQRSQRQALVQAFTRAGIGLDGDRVVLTEGNVTEARNACVELIQGLDLEVTAKTGIP